MTAKVIAFGNRDRGDDGAALVALDALALDPALRARGVVFEAAVPSDLPLALEGVEAAVLMDAADDAGAPGRVLRLRLHDLIGTPSPRASSHGVGVAEALNVCAALGVSPARMTGFAVEGSDFGLGRGLSGPVRDALPELIDRVRSDILGLASQSAP